MRPDREVEHLHVAVDEAFYWWRTMEGHGAWESLYDALRDATAVPECPPLEDTVSRVEPEPVQTATSMEMFERELIGLINSHCIESVVDMPDFLLAGMICSMIEAMGPSVKKTLDWHGCDSICHPAPNDHA